MIAKPERTYDEILASIKARAEKSKNGEAVDNAEPAQKSKSEKVELFVPGMTESMRAMPNHIARSSLFAPVAPGHKKLHKETILVSRSDATIKFSGEQLDESQADVWLQVMYEATKQLLGEPIVINRYAFLKAIGRNTGGKNYKWLHNAMKALAFGMLTIEATKNGQPKMSIGRTRVMHMIESFDYDDKTETYTLRIDPRWHIMYKNREFALIDWEKRMQFGRNQNMGKAMQRLLATSSNREQSYALDWLKSKFEYAGRVWDFVAALESAMRELVRLEIAISWSIASSTKDKQQLTVCLPDPPPKPVEDEPPPEDQDQPE